MQNRFADVLFTAAVFLLVFVALYLGRAADDNRLFSWEWAFAEIDAGRIYLVLIVGLIISFFFSRTAISDRQRIPLLVALSFSVCVPFWNEPELILDASRYFTHAKHIEKYGIGYYLREWGVNIQAWTDLPLVPFLYGLIFTIFGEHRIFIQAFTTTLFSLTTVFTYLIGKTLWNRDIGFSAGLLLLGIPYLLTQVPLMLVDVPVMFFLTLSIYTFLEALNKGGAGRISLSAAAVACTALAKYSAWFMLSVLGIALIVHSVHIAGVKDRRRLMMRGAVTLLLAAAASGAVLLLKSDIVSGQISLLREYQMPGLRRWEESYVSTFLFQMHPFITASALISVIVAILKRDVRYAIISWLVLLGFLFSIKRIRYLLPIFPMLMLMAAYGMQIIRQDILRRFILYGIVSASLAIGIFAYLPLAARMSPANLQQAGAYLNTLHSAEVEVITLPPGEPVANHAVSVPLLDFFTKKRLLYNYNPAIAPALEEFKRSSLRFTWEYRNPEYYTPAAAGPDTPVVVISDASSDQLEHLDLQRLEGYRLSRAFRKDEGIFKYTVGVRIYQNSDTPDSEAGK